MHLITTSFSKAALALIACLVMSGNVFGQESLQRTIQTRQDEWASAYNQRATATLARLYSEEAVLVPPGGKPVVGRSNILSFLASIYSQIRQLSLHTEDVRMLGEAHAVEIGYNVYDAVQEDGSVIRRSDNYIVVWEKDESGAWLYLREILNERSTGAGQ